MNGQIQRTASQPSDEPPGRGPRPSWLGCLLARRRARRLERLHWEHEQRFAWFVQDILAACDLTQEDYSLAGGRVVHVPQVVAIDPGPPMTLDVHILPGQLPADFAAHAPAIAYDLEVAEVRVVPLAPSLIRLELLR